MTLRTHGSVVSWTVGVQEQTRRPSGLRPSQPRAATSAPPEQTFLGGQVQGSTPYSDFPRTQASKEGNASGLGVQLPRLPEHSPTDVTRSCLREWAQHRREAKF